MVERTATSRLITALALALVLVAQSVVGAFALGAAGDTSQFDAFGNPLCLGAASHDSGSGPGIPDHSRIPSCCTFACSMFWPSVAAATDLIAIAPSIRADFRVVYLEYRTTPRTEQGYKPGNPRAPPLTI